MSIPVLTFSDINTFRAWDQWMRIAPGEMGLYLHHDEAHMFVLPPLDIHHMADKLRYAVASGRAWL